MGTIRGKPTTVKCFINVKNVIFTCEGKKIYTKPTNVATNKKLFIKDTRRI